MSKTNESAFAAKIRLAGLIVDYLRVYHKDMDITIKDVVQRMCTHNLPGIIERAHSGEMVFVPFAKPQLVQRTAEEPVPQSPYEIAKETCVFMNSISQPVKPFDLWGIFHVALLNLQLEHGGGINTKKMLTMIRYCYQSGATGRSQEELTVHEIAEIYQIEEDETDDETDEDEEVDEKGYEVLWQ